MEWLVLIFLFRYYSDPLILHYIFIESLFGCFDDVPTCCCGCFCTPCLFGRNAEKIDGSNCCLMCCAYSILTSCYFCWVPHYMKRDLLRQKYGLREDPCGDLPTTICCSPCGLCQEARFLKRRGIVNLYHLNIISIVCISISWTTRRSFRCCCSRSNHNYQSTS